MSRIFAAVRAQRPRLSEVAIGLALVALVNVPFWLLQTRYFMARPVFNADLALALTTMAWGRVALVCAVAIAWALDAVQGLSLVYHFPSVADFAATAKFAPTIHFAEFVNAEVIAIVTLFAVGIAIVLWLTKHRGASPRGVILASAVLMLIDVANGSGLPTLFGSDSVVINANVQGSPLLNLASSARHAQKQAAEPLQTVDQPGIASSLQWAKDHEDGALLIVIVESWGEHVDPALRAWSDRRLNAPEVTARWHVTRATSRFKGATTAGELRELCGLSGHYSRLTPEQASACLPNLLKPTGFDAIALHGFSGAMFERTHWWSTLGFTRRVFAEDLPRSAPRCGGAFEGVCDRHMLDLAMAELRPRRLVYLLTLNTHLPLERLPIPDELAALCRERRASESVCRLTAQIDKVQADIVAAVMATKMPLWVSVVGDHSPPFAVDSDRRAYSPTQVPTVRLVPR